MSSIKLVYFDAKARGEAIRLVLEAAGKKYDDVRLTFEQWPAHKSDTPFGQLPYMTYNDKNYGQSVALANFFAREYGMYGKTNMDALRIDEVVGLCADVANSLYTAMFEGDADRKEGLFKKFYDETIPNFMRFTQRLLQENGNSGYFVGSIISLADLFFYNTLDALILHKAEVKASFSPEVTKLRNAVEAHPFLKSYLANRKETTL